VISACWLDCKRQGMTGRSAMVAIRVFRLEKDV
jgi:hypothetical protein